MKPSTACQLRRPTAQLRRIDCCSPPFHRRERFPSLCVLYNTMPKKKEHVYTPTETHQREVRSDSQYNTIQSCPHTLSQQDITNQQMHLLGKELGRIKESAKQAGCHGKMARVRCTGAGECSSAGNTGARKQCRCSTRGRLGREGGGDRGVLWRLGFAARQGSDPSVVGGPPRQAPP